MAVASDQGYCVFSFDYPPNDGGVARLCGEIASHLAVGAPTTVLSQRYDARAQSSTIPPGIPEARVSPRRPLREIAAWWRLARAPRQRPVIVGTWYPEGVVALLAGRRRIAMLAHGAELAPPEQRWRRAIWKYVRRWTLARARVVIANSGYTARFVTSVAPGAKAVAIPLAVDHKRFSPGNREAARTRFGVHDPHLIAVCTVTRIQGFKGIDTVLRAIANLSAAERERIVYLVGGKGPATESLQALAQSLGIAASVRWLGFVPEADLPDLYRAADLFVLCTREQLDQRSVEGFGMVFLEAQACGTPVVGTRTGGIPDAVREGDGGWLIPDDDANALAAILAQLVATPEPFREAGRAGRARIEREATWDDYMTSFRDALSTAGLDA